MQTHVAPGIDGLNAIEQATHITSHFKTELLIAGFIVIVVALWVWDKYLRYR